MQIRILSFTPFMKNTTVLYSNKLKLQFVVTTLEHFDDYYRKLFLKGTVMFTPHSVPRDSFICRLMNPMSHLMSHFPLIVKQQIKDSLDCR